MVPSIQGRRGFKEEFCRRGYAGMERMSTLRGSKNKEAIDIVSEGTHHAKKDG